MSYKNKLNKTFFSFLCLGIIACNDGTDSNLKISKTEEIPINYVLSLPPGGNSWVIDNTSMDQQVISDSGITQWNNSNSIIRTYFKTDSIGELKLGLKAKTTNQATLKITLGKTSKEITLNNKKYTTIDIGTFNITQPGYHYIELEGIEKTGNVYADISEVLIGGSITEKNITYVPNDFHFGRRGPSVHLKYEAPQNIDAVYFYNEITVPKDEDIIGSYYMANGFGEGYFGIQVNSETERRVLFSVWSEFDTQDPNLIPEEYQVNLLGKGTNVYSGEFGNEGSGAQSYLVKNWKTDITYKFLLKVTPSQNSSSDYTAYFYDPDINNWQLIASFRRPNTTTYVTNMHSFLENFSPSTGYITRQANYGNQWVYTTEHEWIEITKATFTYDATAQKGARLDYEGGITAKNTFYLKNCGFFNENTEPNAPLHRESQLKQPTIDFTKLETPTL
ncbi:conserved hypothetical protein (DUF3472) [Formosa agariphila KMM 3901]|uniref:DUF5077 domain-containing protein n=1 Tax=Formosa agariphila (strain DSM 15362 / KCTC 12365 / LMG 23005 / KMM 3901 / M-2Alg 35-1) TaxID=1347342 RepID=T2KNP9_FORAG|nr:DUF5077 domain-containing protein [Formosa agariphila]CDF80350.1 conserved hypothetical protein (DUF3472) [Formosa agariphila KMM 3901]